MLKSFLFPEIAFTHPPFNINLFKHRLKPTCFILSLRIRNCLYQLITDFNSTLPGKFIAWKQTVSWLQQHPQKILTGGGMGNFSSKLAFRTSCIKVAGSYPERFKYINNAFLINHLDLYLFYFSKEDKFHSIINNPFSVYDQLISEYGLSGLSAFFIFYLGFFLRNFKKLTYGIPLILLMTGIFFIDYWFEQLSVVILFEMMLFLNIKEKTQQT